MADAAAKKKVKAGSFQSLNLCSEVYRAVLKLGYKLPTPIQRKTIPSILQGHDVVAMARTGSGKTAAFLIPILDKLKVEHSQVVGARALVLSPTRELALQTAKFCRSFNAYGTLRICILVGGQGMETQFAHLANNPDIIIATPGRLMHHILEADLSLQSVETLVFDEADRLFELGFQEQLQKILNASSHTRQCLLFSATLPSQLIGFSRLGMRDPVFIRLDVETTLSEDLSLQYVYVRRDERDASALMLARKFVTPEKSAIMFVATRHHVEFYGSLLRQAGVYNVCMVYGNMDQTARETEITTFRRKKGLLVTTDLAARGIDIPLLDAVINFHFPSSSKLFVHRAGRTARAGKQGTCVSVVTADDLPYCLDLLLFLGRKLYFPKDGVAEGVLAAMPPLDDELETTKRLLASNDPNNELPTLEKSKTAAYKEYFKTRPSASKQAVRRAKEMLDQQGGAVKLQSIVHPMFLDRYTQQDAEKDKLIDELRTFRPQRRNIGRSAVPVIGDEAWQCEIPHSDKALSSDNPGKRPFVASFDSKKYRAKDFYISVEQDVYQKSKEQGLEIEKFKIDLVADDADNLKKQKAVMRWDARKKKYLPVMLSADGRVNRKQTRKNESGKKVTGEAVKTDIYAKWTKSSKAQIQKIGSLEVSNAGLIDLHGRNGRSAKAARQQSNKDNNTVKNASDLKKTKKTKLKHKLKTNKAFRKEYAKKAKAAWWKAHEEKIAQRAARPRSFVIPKKKEKKNRKPKPTVYLK